MTLDNDRPCSGLKVIDLTQGMSGPMATMILADYGARVIKVEPPGGDWARRVLRGFHMWNRGKESIALDLTTSVDRGQLNSLLLWADVVVTDARPSVAAATGTDHNTLSAINPSIIHCHIGTWAGAQDDDRAVYESQLAAETGQLSGLDVLSGQIVDPSRADPTFRLPPTGSFGAAMLAVQGVLATLVERSKDALAKTPARMVTTSQLQGAMAFLMRQDLARPISSSAEAESELIHRGIELCFLTAECADGRFVQMCARQDHHFRAWLQALDLAHLLDEPRFAAAPMGIGTMADIDDLECQLRNRMRMRTQAEWMHLFTTAHDVGADPFLTPEEFLRHPQMVENGRVATVCDPVLGATAQLGMIVQIDGVTADEFAPAPRLDEHRQQIHTSILAAARPTVAAGRSSPPVGQRLPLDGVTVLEVAYFVAGPLATTLLAEMGARVIKVEPLDGDPYRRTGLQSAKFLTGKESIAVDLKRPEATAILHRLIAQSDAMVHSFRAGVPERLGMDEVTARALRPGIVYLNAASYGSNGPESGRIAFHSTPTALSGAGIAQAGRGNKPVDDSFPDPAAGLGAATALLLGLLAQRRSGRGVALETTMLTSAGYVMSNDTVVSNGSALATVADHDQLGVSATYRLYECSVGWLFVAAIDSMRVEALLATLEIVRPSLDDGDDMDDVLAAQIAQILATDTAECWSDRLRASGVPNSVTSLDLFEVWLEQHGMLTPASHPDYPDFYQTVRRVEFDGLVAPTRPIASIGEHSTLILSELGFAEDEIEHFIDIGAIRQKARTPA